MGRKVCLEKRRKRRREEEEKEEERNLTLSSVNTFIVLSASCIELKETEEEKLFET